MNSELKQITVILDDEDIIELIRILLDQDKPAALSFLEKHIAKRLRIELDNRKLVDEACPTIELDR